MSWTPSTDGCTSRSSYRPGTTYIGQDIGAVLAGGTGVCQDFVHVGLAMLRAVGVPARYVSGYFYAIDGTDGAMPNDAEARCRPTPGWRWPSRAGAGGPSTPRTISPPVSVTCKIGHGRDYDDVLPLRGVYHGTSDQHLFVEVGMSRASCPPWLPLPCWSRRNSTAAVGHATAAASGGRSRPAMLAGT